MTGRILSWLRGDLGDVVVVSARPHPRAGVQPAELDIEAGLGRWAAQFTVWRASVLGARYLGIGVCVALIPAVIVLAVGAPRPFWVLGLLLLGPLALGVALTQRTSQVRAARAVDRALGLHEQLGTGLELQRRGAPAAGLPGMVLSDARSAVAQSVREAHVRARRAPLEWAWILLAIAALGVVLAVPRHRPLTAPGETGLAARTGAAGAPAARTTTTSRATTASRTTASGVTSTPTSGATAAVQRVPLTGGARAAYGVQANRPAGSHAPIDAKGTSTLQDKHAKDGLAVSGQVGAAGSASPQTGSSQASAAAKAGAQQRAAAGAAASKPAAGQPKSAAASSAQAQTTTSAHSAPSSGQRATTQQAAGHSAAVQSHASGGIPTAGAAGTGKAAAHSKLGLTPYGGAGTGKLTLPLQAGYTPAGPGHLSIHGGSDKTTSGDGSSAGRAGHPGATTSSQPATPNFSVIPPTANGSSLDPDLVQNYFGTANQLTFKGW